MCSCHVYIPSFVSLCTHYLIHQFPCTHTVWECIPNISTLVFGCDLYFFPLVKDRVTTANATVRAKNAEEIKLTRALQAAERRVETEQVN